LPAGGHDLANEGERTCAIMGVPDGEVVASVALILATDDDE
jgi:hypothetical protein